MKILLVSNFIPGGRPVSEYCYYLVEALRKIDEIAEITVLADIVQGKPPITRDGKVTIRRCWEFNSHLTPWRVAKTIRSLNPEICWFNITLGSFGMTTANFAGLLSPLIVERLLGIPCLITLHNIVDLTDTRETKFRGGKLTILGARIATRILCKASLVSVLLPEYEPILRRRYGAMDVKIVPLGTLGQPINWPYNSETKRILSLGIFGTHKRLETTLEAMESLYAGDPTIKLTIVGGSNVHNPDYLAKLQQKFRSLPNVDFVGYVPEDCVADVFRECRAVILPYQTIGGESATLIQAGMYARPILVSDLPLFRRKAEDGYILNFFDVNDPESIKEAILALLRQDQETLARQGKQNFRAATSYPMSEVAQIYVDLIEEILNKKEGGV